MQESLSSKGPNFAIAPNNPPHLDLITAIESVCHRISDQDSQEHRAETKCLLRKARAPKANLTREENKALKGVMTRSRQNSSYSGQEGGYGSIRQKGIIRKSRGIIGAPGL